MELTKTMEKLAGNITLFGIPRDVKLEITALARLSFKNGFHYCCAETLEILSNGNEMFKDVVDNIGNVKNADGKSNKISIEENLQQLVGSLGKENRLFRYRSMIKSFCSAHYEAGFRCAGHQLKDVLWPTDNMEKSVIDILFSVIDYIDEEAEAYGFEKPEASEYDL